MLEEQQPILRKQTQDQSQPKEINCQDYVSVILQPYIKTKLKPITQNKVLYEKEAQVHQAMYKVHKELDGAKNLYFYTRKLNGKYVQIHYDMKFKVLQQRYRDKNGIVTLYYHNDYIGRNKCLDVTFNVAQVVVFFYVLLLIVGYLRVHEYI